MTGVLLNRPTVFPTLRKNRLWKVMKPLLQPRGSSAQALDDIRKHRWREVRWERSIEPTLHLYTITFGSIAEQASPGLNIPESVSGTGSGLTPNRDQWTLYRTSGFQSITPGFQFKG